MGTSTIEIAHDGNRYRATIDGNRIEIDVREPGMWVGVGMGRLDGTDVECDAVLPDGVYDDLETEIADTLYPPERIARLRDAAGEAGDTAQYELCRRALSSREDREAMAACARAIQAIEAMRD
jgi:hypothetical protein